MPKKFKGENTRVTAAKERKAAHQAEIASKKQVEKERKESQEWGVGAKNTSKQEAQRIKKALLAKKNEAAKLLEQEEKELSKYKPILKPPKVTGEEKKAIKRTQKQEVTSEERRVIPEYSASNIEDAIDLLSVATEASFPNGNLNSVGISNASNNIIEKHPEKRFKAALAAYEEREMPRLKKENPGLRYTQLNELLFKNFQKSPENPFNQTNIIQYNSSREEQKNLIETTIKNVEDRLKI
nr:7519_t:CDS:2 [Entrophospora candida]